MNIEKVIEVSKDILMQSGELRPHVLAVLGNGDCSYIPIRLLDDSKESARMVFAAAILAGRMRAERLFFVSDCYAKHEPIDGPGKYPGVLPRDVPLDDRQECVMVYELEAASAAERVAMASYTRVGGHPRFTRIDVSGYGFNETGGMKTHFLRFGFDHGMSEPALTDAEIESMSDPV